MFFLVPPTLATQVNHLACLPVTWDCLLHSTVILRMQLFGSNVIPRQAGGVFPRNLLGMQVLRPYLETDQKLWE